MLCFQNFWPWKLQHLVGHQPAINVNDFNIISWHNCAYGFIKHYGFQAFGSQNSSTPSYKWHLCPQFLSLIYTQGIWHKDWSYLFRGSNHQWGRGHWTICEIPIVGWFTPYSFHRRKCKNSLWIYNIFEKWSWSVVFGE
jgi:hypothetical protein